MSFGLLLAIYLQIIRELSREPSPSYLMFLKVSLGISIRRTDDFTRISFFKVYIKIFLIAKL